MINKQKCIQIQRQRQDKGKILKCIKCDYFLSSYQKDNLRIDFNLYAQWICPSCSLTNIINLKRQIQNHNQLKKLIEKPKINFIDQSYFQESLTSIYENNNSKEFWQINKFIIIDYQLIKSYFQKQQLLDNLQNTAYIVQNSWRQQNKQNQNQNQNQSQNENEKLIFPIKILQKSSPLLYKYNDIRTALLRKKYKELFNLQAHNQKRDVTHGELILFLIDQLLFDIRKQNCQVFILKFQNQQQTENIQIHSMKINTFINKISKGEIKQFHQTSSSSLISICASIKEKINSKYYNNSGYQQTFQNDQSYHALFCLKQSSIKRFVKQMDNCHSNNSYQSLFKSALVKMDTLIYVDDILMSAKNHYSNSKQVLNIKTINKDKKIQKIPQNLIHHTYQFNSIEQIAYFLKQNRIQGRMTEFINMNRTQLWNTHNFQNIQFYHLEKTMQNKGILQKKYPKGLEKSNSPFSKKNSQCGKVLFVGSSLRNINDHINQRSHKIYACFYSKKIGKMIKWYFFNKMQYHKNKPIQNLNNQYIQNITDIDMDMNYFKNFDYFFNQNFQIKDQQKPKSKSQNFKKQQSSLQFSKNKTQIQDKKQSLKKSITNQQQIQQQEQYNDSIQYI